jgi:hypothetical protein
VTLVLRVDGSSLPGVLAAIGVVCVIAGTYMVTTSGILWTLPVGIVTVFCSSVGLNIAADARELAHSGQRVACTVAAVTPHVVRTIDFDEYGRPRTRTHTEYQHTMECSSRTYTAVSGVREPVGEKTDMIHTSGDELVFPESAEVRYGLGLASVGGLTALFLPFAVQSIERFAAGRRRRPAQEPPAQPDTAAPPG